MYYLMAVEVPWSNEGGVKVICEETEGYDVKVSKSSIRSYLGKTAFRIVSVLSKLNLSQNSILRNNKLICSKKYRTEEDLLFDLNDLCKVSCPTKGECVGYHVDKKNGVVLGLLVSSRARRTSAYFSKLCRCDFAQIVSIEDKEGNGYKVLGQYKLGMELTNKDYTDNRYVKTSGISFYMDKEEADRKNERIKTV